MAGFTVQLGLLLWALALVCALAASSTKGQKQTSKPLTDTAASGGGSAASSGGGATLGSGSWANDTGEETLQAAETRLRKLLLSDYDIRTAPASRTGPVDVQLGLNFYKIHSLDLPSSMLTLVVWLRESWTDPRLNFSAGGFPPMPEIMEHPYLRVYPGEIWVPDIELWNHEESVHQTLADEGAMVYEGGHVFRSRPGLMKVLCRFRGLRNFPWDLLSCNMEFGAWITDGTLQNITLRRADCGFTWPGGTGCKDSALGTSGSESGMSFQEYTIEGFSVKRSITYFDCCKSTPWPTVLYTISLMRAQSYYVAKLVVPLIMLTYASFATFWMSPATGERLGFAITIILAIIAADIVASEMLPVCKEQLWMAVLTYMSFFFSIVALFETGIVLYLYHCNAESWLSMLPKPLQLMARRSDRGSDFWSWQSVVPSDGAGDADGGEVVRRNSTAARLSKLKSMSVAISTPGRSDTVDEIPRGVDSNASPRSAAFPRYGSGLPGSVESPEPSDRDSGSPRSPASPKGWIHGKPFKRSHTSRSTCQVSSLPPLKAGSKPGLGEVQEFRVRCQLYRQAFNTLDEHCCGRLSVQDIDKFGYWMLGYDWTPALCEQFMQQLDKNQDNWISEEEFIDFCESAVVSKATEDGSEVMEYVETMIQGFLHMVDLHRNQVIALWQKRAERVDLYASYLLVGSYTIGLLALAGCDFELQTQKLQP